MKFITKNGKKIPIGNKGFGKFVWNKEPVKFKAEALSVFYNSKGVSLYKTKKWNELPSHVKKDVSNLWNDTSRDADKEQRKKEADSKISDAKIPYEERKVEVKIAGIEDIDNENRKIDSTGSKMIGGIDPVNKEGVTKMVNHSRKVGTLVGDLFD